MNARLTNGKAFDQAARDILSKIQRGVFDDNRVLFPFPRALLSPANLVNLSAVARSKILPTTNSHRRSTDTRAREREERLLLTITYDTTFLSGTSIAFFLYVRLDFLIHGDLKCCNTYSRWFDSNLEREAFRQMRQTAFKLF
jgi:hypothetical protein